MPDRVMLDLETLGTEPGCAILSIGAVQFGVDDLGATFHRSLDLTECQEYGLGIDAETLQWWLDQSSDVQTVLTDGGDTVAGALTDFANFADGVGEIWAKSPAFDCAILEAVYDQLALDRPWDYWQTRDVRTALALADVDVKREGAEHDALADATHQARQVQQVLRTVGD